MSYYTPMQEKGLTGFMLEEATKSFNAGSAVVGEGLKASLKPLTRQGRLPDMDPGILRMVSVKVIAVLPPFLQMVMWNLIESPYVYNE